MKLMHSPITVNLIGAGKLGKSIAYLLRHRAGACIQGIFSKTATSARAASDFIGAGSAYKDIATLPRADLWLIATTDEAIPGIAEELSHYPDISKDVAIHFSGSLTAAELKPLADRGMKIASVHPMYSFAQPHQVIENYENVYCAIEGDSELIPELSQLFIAIGSIPFEISSADKGLYHAAGVFASNYLITLAHSALTCLSNAQVPEEISLNLIIKLMRSTLNNLESTASPIEALTGPLQRGDSKTITTHLNALPQLLVELYQTLGKYTLPLTRHGKEKKQQLALLLESCE